MFKQVIFGLVMVAALTSAAKIEKRKHNSRMTPEAQEGFHSLLDLLAGLFRISDLGQGLDPFPVEQVVLVNTSQMLDGKLMTTEIFVQDVTINGLSTLHRTGPSALTILGNNPIGTTLALVDIELDAGFQPVTIEAVFTAKSNGVGIDNLRAQFTLRNVQLYMWIRANLALVNSKLDIKGLTIKDLGHLDIDIKGLGLIEIVAEPIIELVANLIKNLVAGIIAGIVKNSLQQLFDSIINSVPTSSNTQVAAVMEKLLANFN